MDVLHASKPRPGATCFWDRNLGRGGARGPASGTPPERVNSVAEGEPHHAHHARAGQALYGHGELVLAAHEAENLLSAVWPGFGFERVLRNHAKGAEDTTSNHVAATTWLHCNRCNCTAYV